MAAPVRDHLLARGPLAERANAFLGKAWERGWLPPPALDPEALWVIADATGGSLRVELVDPFDRVIPGFSQDDCVPFTADDTEHRITWKAPTQGAERPGDGLEQKMVSQPQGGVKVKVYLDRARLFALYAAIG